MIRGCLNDYYYFGKFPIYAEYRIRETLVKLEWEEFNLEYGMALAETEHEKIKYKAKMRFFKEKKAKTIEEEIKKVDKFCEILCTSEKNHREAEKEAYGSDENFYLKCNEKEKVVLTKKKRKKRLKRKPKLPKKASEELTECFYLEKVLKNEEREKLLAEGYKRLKISPFGDSGAAYYWIKTRYNESKEHAFFCYLIKTELEKQGIEAELKVNNGPDVVFEYRGKNFCFDVETGENLKKHPGFVGKKFSRYKKEYDGNYILVTNKKLKYKYSKHGKVVTRSMLRKTISEIAKKSKR